MIIGCSGCGKTTFAKELSDKLSLPLVHLDILYWRDNWEPVNRDEFDKLILEEVNKVKWVLDGNHNRTIITRLKYCDTAIYMDYSRLECLYGSIKRMVKNYGNSRPDMGGYCPERLDIKKIELFKSIWNFNKYNRKKYYDILQNTENTKIVIFKTRKEARAFLKEL